MMTGTPEYRAWWAIKTRCYNEKANNYHRYGGRGIVMCSHWLESPRHFLDDVGVRPDIKNKSGRSTYSIDRIDNDGNYSCGHCKECVDNNWTMNCKWSTNLEQTMNRTLDYNKAYSNNTSGYRGVCFDKSVNKYQVSISINGKRKIVGYEESAEDAHKLYMKAYGELSS